MEPVPEFDPADDDGVGRGRGVQPAGGGRPRAAGRPEAVEDGDEGAVARYEAVPHHGDGVAGHDLVDRWDVLPRVAVLPP